MEKKFSKGKAKLEAVRLCSECEKFLTDPSWHPFKIIKDEEGNPKVFSFKTNGIIYETNRAYVAPLW